MQTFLPLPNYFDSMRCLDPKRLGNQIWREGLTLIRGGWKHHPASKMWKNHEYHLGLYLLEGCKILEERGKAYPAVIEKIKLEMAKHKNTGHPPWFGDNRLHSSHRSALLYKNFDWYKKFNWTELPAIPINEKGTLPYWWPKT